MYRKPNSINYKLAIIYLFIEKFEILLTSFQSNEKTFCKRFVHTWTSRWSNGGGGQFSTRKIFKKFLGGWKIFPFHFLVNFDVFLVDFDAKTQMRGEICPKFKMGVRKKGVGQTP